MVMVKERIGSLVRHLSALCEKNAEKISNAEYLVLKGQIKDLALLNGKEWNKFPGSMDLGGNDEYYYIRMQVKLPESYEGQRVIFGIHNFGGVRWDTVNPQFRLYVNGKLRQGLDENHEAVVLEECGRSGEVYDIILCVYTGKMHFHSILDARIAVRDREIEKYYYDVKVPYDVAGLMKEDEKECYEILLTLNESLNLLDFRKAYSTEFYESLAEAQAYLDKEFYEKRCNKEKEEVWCVGHTHIDIAWLWTLETAKDKAVRSFSTVLRLMEEYPEYRFMSSQPHLYKAVKEREPAVYEEIKHRIEEGRWEAEGGMFVEADCNLTGGESLVRQFVKGKAFFKKEFQKENEVLWLPDVFGYSAALPQIMLKCGVRYFMTTKISWNEFNKMPYDTFNWIGIDGSRVLTHFVPASDYDKSLVSKNFFTTYNGMLEPSQVKGSWQRYQQKYLNSEVLMAYGYGDGGGGPTREMLEAGRRMEKGIPGCPVTKQSSSNEFFHKLEEEVKGKKYLPEWSGELYLEYHRGTYTSMARNKKYNRKAEFLLHNIELFSVMDSKLNRTAYPKEQLDDLWETLLRNQFHDILPGSSIEEVYEVSRKEYEDLFLRGNALLTRAVNSLTDSIGAEKGAIAVFNPNGFKGTGYVLAEAENAADSGLVTDGENYCPYEKLEDGKILFRALTVPAAGYKVYTLADGGAPETNLRITDNSMENSCIRIIFNEKGQFLSVYDKENDREVLKPGECGNVIMSYEDRPHNWDAWDVNNYYGEKSWEIDKVTEMKVVESGSLRACMKVERKYLDSTITQYIFLYHDSRRIDIKTEVDWKQDHILLKALFPVDIHSNEADYEIQYGNVTRPTHHNTSWDAARFEVCHHKWLDIHENNYGVSLINDCKYGCHVHEGVIGLSLLKSATSPNPSADKEKHEFTYSFYPHKDDFRTGGTVKEAYELNNPLFAAVKSKGEGDKPVSYSAAETDCENVILEVVKAAEEPEENVQILRLYEYYNQRNEVKMTLPEEAERIAVCSMLEEEEEIIGVNTKQVSFGIKPYEIVTLKIVYKKQP